MEEYKMILNFIGITTIIIGIVQVIIRINFLNHKDLKNGGVGGVLLGSIFLPLVLNEDDSKSVLNIKKKINFLLKLFYFLFIIVIFGLIIYSVLLEQ